MPSNIATVGPRAIQRERAPQSLSITAHIQSSQNESAAPHDTEGTTIATNTNSDFTYFLYVDFSTYTPVDHLRCAYFLAALQTKEDNLNVHDTEGRPTDGMEPCSIYLEYGSLCLLFMTALKQKMESRFNEWEMPEEWENIKSHADYLRTTSNGFWQLLDVVQLLDHA